MLSKVRDIIQADGVSALASRSIAYAYRQGVRPFIPRRELSATRASPFAMMSSGATASFQNCGSLFSRGTSLTMRLPRGGLKRDHQFW
jgi:hypothetical protein